MTMEIERLAGRFVDQPAVAESLKAIGQAAREAGAPEEFTVDHEIAILARGFNELGFKGVGDGLKETAQLAKALKTDKLVGKRIITKI